MNENPDIARFTRWAFEEAKRNWNKRDVPAEALVEALRDAPVVVAVYHMIPGKVGIELCKGVEIMESIATSGTRMVEIEAVPRRTKSDALKLSAAFKDQSRTRH
jgi:hypothetical protein